MWTYNTNIGWKPQVIEEFFFYPEEKGIPHKNHASQLDNISDIPGAKVLRNEQDLEEVTPRFYKNEDFAKIYKDMIGLGCILIELPQSIAEVDGTKDFKVIHHLTFNYKKDTPLKDQRILRKWIEKAKQSQEGNQMEKYRRTPENIGYGDHDFQE